MAKKKKVREGSDPRSAMNPDLGKTIAVTVTGEVYIYENMERCTLTPQAMETSDIWETVEGLMDLPKMRVHGIYEGVTGVSPPTRWDKEEMAIETWLELIKRATDMTDPAKREGGTVKKSDGRRDRKRKLDDRTYVLGDPPTDGVQIPLPPQARVCYQILVDACGEEMGVSESVLREVIMKRAVELKTRQDPWRIFQYYRPQLIAARLVRMPPME